MDLKAPIRQPETPAGAGLIPEFLRKRLAERRCVAYVGAGFSMACGMPNWEGLLRRLLRVAEEARPFCSGDDRGREIEACLQAIEDKQFDWAATLLRRLIPSSELYRTIQELFDDDVLRKAPPAAGQAMEGRTRDLVKGPWAGIVTTNYDSLIELALGKYPGRKVVKALGDSDLIGYLLATLPPDGLFFVKPHGSLGGQNLVLSTEDYDQTYLRSPRLTEFLKVLFHSFYIVFIGCSLEDQVVKIRHELAVTHKGNINPAFALLPNVPPNRRRVGYLSEYAKIECILYDVPDGDPLHRPVGDFLAEAAKLAEPSAPESVARDLTRSQLAGRDLAEKLGHIGAINRALLRLIASRPDRSLGHAELIDPTRIDAPPAAPRLLAISPEERVYRALFLVSVGLLSERPGPDGAIRYALGDGVTPEALNPADSPG